MRNVAGAAVLEMHKPYKSLANFFFCIDLSLLTTISPNEWSSAAMRNCGTISNNPEKNRWMNDSEDVRQTCWPFQSAASQLCIPKSFIKTKN